MDLEDFKRDRGLSYRRLAGLLGMSQGRTAQAYARGELWPDADRIENIITLTDGAVTLEAMHRRRLEWLRENNRTKNDCTLAENSQGHVHDST